MRKVPLAISLAAFFAVWSHAADTERNYVVPPKSGTLPSAPFSSGVMVGETFYVAGHLGLDPGTKQAPADADAAVLEVVIRFRENRTLIEVEQRRVVSRRTIHEAANTTPSW